MIVAIHKVSGIPFLKTPLGPPENVVISEVSSYQR